MIALLELGMIGCRVAALGCHQDPGQAPPVGADPGPLWQQALEIWVAGDWAMWALALIAMVMFGLGAHIYLCLREKGFESVPERTWRRWIDHPKERRGPIGDMLDFVTGGSTVHETAGYFDQLRAAESAPFERDLLVMRISVSAAPLVGLLGTVTGMLATFGALSSGAGGDKTMSMIAAGISEALITTETGLVIALPGVFFLYQLSRKFGRYQAVLSHLESVCIQVLHRDSRERELSEVQAAARAAAQAVVTRQLRTALVRRNLHRGPIAKVPQVAGVISADDFDAIDGRRFVGNRTKETNGTFS